MPSYFGDFGFVLAVQLGNGDDVISGSCPIAGSGEPSTADAVRNDRSGFVDNSGRINIINFEIEGWDEITVCPPG